MTTPDDLAPGRPPDHSMRVAVPGGAVAVGRWGDGPARVLCSHGITANHRSFNAVAARLVDRGVAVAAIDHRGRGGSARHPGPFGLTTHADDLVAVAAEVTDQRLVLVGHSMGGWVAANALATSDAPWHGGVLVDGGVPTPPPVLPEDVDVEAVIGQVIGPAMARLDLTFRTRDDALDLWRGHPAVGPVFPALVDYLMWDLEETAAGWTSRVARDAVIADGRDTLLAPRTVTALARSALPATLLLAGRGLLDEDRGLLDPDAARAAVAHLDQTRIVEVPDVNHYSIMVREPGVRAIVAAVLDLLPS